MQHTNEICKWPKGPLPTLKVNVERLIIFSSNQQRLGLGSHSGPLKTDTHLKKANVFEKVVGGIQQLNLSSVKIKSYFKANVFKSCLGIKS